MKYFGKEKCRILKEIRAEIAKANDIEWVVSECKHQGNCKGTCPKCEQEVRELEAALARREVLGKKVAVVGISAAIALAVTGCEDPFGTTAGEPLDGDMPAPPEATADGAATEVSKGEIIPDTDLIMGMLPIEGEIVEETDGEFDEETAEETTESESETDTETETEFPVPGEPAE